MEDIRDPEKPFYNYVKLIAIGFEVSKTICGPYQPIGAERHIVHLYTWSER